MCFDTGNENGGGEQKAHNLCTNFQCKTVPLSTVCVWTNLFINLQHKTVSPISPVKTVSPISPRTKLRNAQELENSFIIFSQNAKL